MVAPAYAIMAPWALAGMAIDQIQEKQLREAARRTRANPERVPIEVANSVSSMGDLTADTIDQLLDTTGLTAYRKDVLIVFLGTTQQDLWIYYRPDAALTARFDPITRRIVGPIKNYSGRRLLETGRDADP